MNYYSLERNSIEVSFKEAVIRGIAPDRGLYFPEHIRPLRSSFFRDINTLSNEEIAFRAMRQFVSPEIPEKILREILAKTLDFDFPLVHIEKGVAALELYHGPTMAFKDVGARFMAHCLGYFSQDNNQEVTVLVATSGDTGGAVANGFLGVEGVKVVILYPSGKVSDIQERQLTTLGNNITALEVDGTFDDCQAMVKSAFLDDELEGRVRLTSANSINVARWLPQMIYYFLAYKMMQDKRQQLVFAVPSGNFGNICAGMVAQRLGLPVSHFVAATNINDTVPQFMESGQYEPKPSSPTISNAMDVGDPSNFVRILHLYNDQLPNLASTFSSYSFTDQMTREAMADLYQRTGYIADPHGAVGYLGLKKYQESNPECFGIFLETAHPIKFRDVVEDTLNTELEVPKQIKAVLDKDKTSIPVKTYEELRSYLLSVN
ncbi:threonine synthase [Zeaxanthinibacter enoshimensis]|uniref:Threonine synthase n=1 Tax=Zeaxanthinibacter enoshimensis TaxID=392009 RepID=A0A4R6TMG1_9FLAO|nr:threonine synthase [Zeaxanthinibacter enoshimensis]TDQ31038.1 threonine synthase [Zeaxanthinibacter enoshimensis]